MFHKMFVIAASRYRYAKCVKQIIFLLGKEIIHVCFQKQKLFLLFHAKSFDEKN